LLKIIFLVLYKTEKPRILSNTIEEDKELLYAVSIAAYCRIAKRDNETLLILKQHE
jgi:hypothetical protein